MSGSSASHSARRRKRGDNRPQQHAPLPDISPDWKSRLPSILYRSDDYGHQSGDDDLASRKVAAFDLDGTLIRWKEGRGFDLRADSWLWYRSSVPAVLQVRPYVLH